MIDPFLEIPVDAAYREETARLLERLGLVGAAWTSERSLCADTVRHASGVVRAWARVVPAGRWSYVAAAHRLEVIARSLEEK